MTIIYLKQAIKAITRMDSTTKKRISQGIEIIPKGDIKPLQGAPNHYRLRIGDWWILFSYEEDIIKIKKIAPRGEVYKGGLKMSPVRNQLINMIDCLPEQEQVLLIEIVKRFIPDDVATPDDLEAIRLADEEFASGEYAKHEDINWN